MNSSPPLTEQAPPSREPVRLIIWDLDETFWAGTLTEGGIAKYIDQNHDLVIGLAHRGIMSSICSKNNFDEVRDVLVRKGLWDYFIFPSVDWSPKPERVAEIIESVQLRPATVMFIDDHPSNRAAVAARNPGIQTEAETFIPEILDHCLFKGKSDPDLTRLKQYKLLETRQLERSKAEDNKQFLHLSQIEVEVNVNLEEHYLRIIELINRTNQLNFTKKRFSEVQDVALEELQRQLQPSHEVVAGLVRVKDRYGDYGYCGFYLLRWGKIEHFCFSCRILGFGVETWLYQQMGRPRIEIVGEVLTDLKVSEPVDWINASRFAEDTQTGTKGDAISRIGIISHCEGAMIGHYFRMGSNRVEGEGLYQENGVALVGDSLANMYFRSGSRYTRYRDAFGRLGFTKITEHKLLAGSNTFLPVITFCHRDFPHYIYKHNQTDLCLNVTIQNFSGDLCGANFGFLQDLIRQRSADEAEFRTAVDVLTWLRSAFSTLPLLSEELLHLQQHYLRTICQEAGGGTRLFAIMKSSKLRQSNKQIVESKAMDLHRALILSEAKSLPNLVPIDLGSCINSDDEILDSQHYDRIVYYRLFKLISKTIVEMRS